MGLLTDPKSREKFTNILLKYYSVLSILCYFAGFCWMLSLAFREFTAGTYFSENALLPGLVQGSYNGENEAAKILEKLKSFNETETGYTKKAYIMDMLRDFGLEVYTHNYTLYYPLDNIRVPNLENFYGILRAPRSASTESIVVTTPFRDDTLPGIAVMLSLVKSFRRHSYWAKDIIFLLTEAEQVGVHSWLNAYHSKHSDIFQNTELSGRAGSIQAAINFELTSVNLGGIDVKIEGLNGQLPNMDLFNLVVRLCRQESIPVSLHGRTDHWRPHTLDGYLHSLSTLLSMMLSQASGRPTGDHGFFQQFNIEAVSLVSVPGRGNQRVTYRKMGRIFEGIFRSLNNLLERFHQSFFFYLLPSTDRYVSIGMYMPPFGLLCAPAIIQALVLWTRLSNRQEGSEQGDQRSTIEMNVTLASVLPLFGICHIMGLLVYLVPRMFSFSLLQMTSSETIVYSLVSVFAASLCLPRIIMRRGETERDLFTPDTELLKLVSLLEFSLVLGATALLNFSLSAIIAVATVPVFVCVQSGTNRLKKVVQSFFCFLASPPAMLCIVIALTKLFTSRTNQDLVTFMNDVFRTWTHAVVTSILDNYLYAVWTFPLVALLVFPIWIQFWCLIWSPES